VFYLTISTLLIELNLMDKVYTPSVQFSWADSFHTY